LKTCSPNSPLRAGWIKLGAVQPYFRFHAGSITAWERVCN
jgi:hypothetical protein